MQGMHRMHRPQAGLSRSRSAAPAAAKPAHAAVLPSAPSVRRREHGETLSKLEKKAALTLQMNFQVAAACAACAAVLLHYCDGCVLKRWFSCAASVHSLLIIPALCSPPHTQYRRDEEAEGFTGRPWRTRRRRHLHGRRRGASPAGCGGIWRPPGRGHWRRGPACLRSCSSGGAAAAGATCRRRSAPAWRVRRWKARCVPRRRLAAGSRGRRQQSRRPRCCLTPTSPPSAAAAAPQQVRAHGGRAPPPAAPAARRGCVSKTSQRCQVCLGGLGHGSVSTLLCHWAGRGSWLVMPLADWRRPACSHCRVKQVGQAAGGQEEEPGLCGGRRRRRASAQRQQRPPAAARQRQPLPRAGGAAPGAAARGGGWQRQHVTAEQRGAAVG